MTSKKIAVLVLVGLVLALAIGIISAPDVREGPVMKPAVKNASVSPPVGNYTDSFNYSVDVRFYEEVEIELQIYHPIEGKFKPYEVRKYTGSRGWQTLWWNGTTFGPEWEGEDVKYCFSWKGAELLFGEGPHIREELTWEFRNESVNPAYGYYNTPFTYGVEVKSNKEEEIHLEIFNISSSKWEEPGEPQNYTEKGTWQPRIWPNISNIASKDCKGGHSSFRFFFIESENRYESDTIDYPIIYPLEHHIDEAIFENANVDPDSGCYNTSFMYSVEVNTSEKVVLKVYDISTDEWVEKGIGTKTGNRREWEDIQFNKDCKGVASYKFVAGTDESKIFNGPMLELYSTPSPTLTPTPTPRYYGGGGGGGGGSSYKPYMLYENANVDPSWEVIGVREEKSFNYRVDVDRDVSLVLAIYNASSKEWEEKGGIGEESRLKDRWRHEWRVNLTLDKNWEGTSKYRFYPDKQERYASQIFYGPEIKTTEASLAGWKKEIGVAEKALKEPEISATVTPSEASWFKKFTYTATIKHPAKANMTVVLFVKKPGSNEKKSVPWSGYQYNPIIHFSDKSDTAELSWTVEKKDVFDEEDAGERSEFYIWYWDGYNEYNESEGSKFDGPTLLVNKAPEFVGVPKLNPVNGSIYTVYEYRFDVNDPENDAVYGFLTIKDPLNEDRFTKTEKGEKGFIRFLVGPDQEIFTEDKLTKTNKGTFTSQYQLVYWDEGMDVKGERNTTPWFEGPNVSKIRIEHKVEPLKPESGKYNDVFEYTVSLKSSEKNNFLLDLTIYDSSNPKDVHPLPRKNLTVDAGTWGYAYWNIKPEVFGPDDFGKNASYTIAWKDKSGIGDIINGSGPYIERAVPLLSCDPPLVPIISMVIVPSLVFLSSLLLVRYNLREVYGWWKKKWLKTK